MVLDSDPEYVIRRFESGRYAVNSDVRLVYQKALDMTGVREHLVQLTLLSGHPRQSLSGCLSFSF